MGWYDAYKIDNTSKVNLNVNSNGSAAKTFGDAFKEIGSSLIDSENRKKQTAANTKKEKLLDIQTQTAKANLANINSETEQKAEEWVQKQDNQDYLSKAFGATSKEDFEKNYPLDKTNSVTPDVIKKADDYFQAKFNDEAINTSINGGYKSYKDFATANPELVKNADGTTMAKISKQFADNDIRGIQTQTAKANLANINSETEQKAEEWVQKQDNQDFLTAIHSATSKEDFEKNYPLDKTNSVTPDVIKKADDYFQAKFNDEAINTSINGGYKSYKDFATANPELVKNADGTTVTKISKYFTDNNTKVAKPLSIAAQNTLSKMIQKDNYIIDDSGKVSFDEDGKAKLKEGISPVLNDYITEYVYQYMSTPGSDKNYINARAEALLAWDSLPADSKEKQLHDEQTKPELSTWQKTKNFFNSNKDEEQISKSSLLSDFLKAKKDKI